MREDEPFLAHVPGIQYGVLDTLTGYAVRRVQIQAYEDFMASLAPWHITPPRFSAMTIIALNPGLKLTQLARVLGIARSGAVMLVDALEELGYVSREPMPEDKRAFSLVMTDKGHLDLESITAAVQAHDVRITTGLTSRERETFWRLLRKMTGMDDRP